MIDLELVHEAFARSAPEGWVDTPEQAQLRQCLANILSGHDPVATVKIAHALITLMRDQLAGATATVRRMATAEASKDHTRRDLVKMTGLTEATVARLLQEARSL
jgi:CRP-like cAMP-binding protein